jgi:hypothetical protein
VGRLQRRGDLSVAQLAAPRARRQMGSGEAGVEVRVFVSGPGLGSVGEAGGNSESVFGGNVNLVGNRRSLRRRSQSKG